MANSNKDLRIAIIGAGKQQISLSDGDMNNN
jgi:hypothetical protein